MNNVTKPFLKCRLHGKIYDIALTSLNVRKKENGESRTEYRCRLCKRRRDRQRGRLLREKKQAARLGVANIILAKCQERGDSLEATNANLKYGMSLTEHISNLYINHKEVIK